VHGTLSQQSESTAHDWPYRAHVPASPVPPQGPQTPCVDPAAVMQLSPAQQSAFTVQPPHAGTHDDV